MKEQDARLEENPKISNLLMVELICSKICHDLIGPVNGLSMGVELFRDSDADKMVQEHLNLLQSSLDKMASFLNFIRQAYGFTHGRKSLDEKAFRTLCEELLGKKNIQLILSLASESKLFLTAEHTKLFLQIVLQLSEFLPRGGMMSVEEVEGRVAVKVSGFYITVPSEIQQFVENQNIFLSPRLIQMKIIYDYLDALGMKISFINHSKGVENPCVEIVIC